MNAPVTLASSAAIPTPAITPKAAVNDKRYPDLITAVRELGREAALGKDSLPKLALKVVAAAADKVITGAKATNKNDPDDAEKLYQEYVAAESKKAIHEHSDGGKKANISKLRQLVRLGELANKAGGGDPVSMLNDAVRIRGEMQDAGEKVLPAYHAYVNIARKAVEAESADLTDDEIKAACRTKEPEEKTVEKEVERIQKSLEKLITGEGGLTCQDQEIIDAHDKLRAWTQRKAGEAELAAFIEKARELGVDVSKFSPHSTAGLPI